MAGGTWTSQNKVLPGVYINVQSRENVNINVGNRGVVAIPEALSWGPAGEVMQITPGEPLEPYIGYDITNPNAMFLREMMKGSDVTSGPIKILLYRLPGTGGEEATATVGTLTATALYEGVRGNDITIVIAADPDNVGTYEVGTVVDGYIVDTQSVTDLDDLAANAWVTFDNVVPWENASEYDATATYEVGDYCVYEGQYYICTTAIASGEAWNSAHWDAVNTGITTTVGTPLTGGVNPTTTNADYASAITAFEPYAFDILAYDGTEPTVITAFKQFVTRMNDSIGRKCQAVMAGDAAALNSKFVIAVKNGVKLIDGTELSAQQAVWWVAGAEAGALYNQSLTYAQYPGALAANPKLTDEQAEEAIRDGFLCFVDTFDIVKVCTDINSKTSVTPKEGAEFKKNRVMRVVNQLCNDAYEQFSAYFIGKVDNNDNGRNLLRAWLIGYLNEMQANNGIQNFTAEDVSVEPGSAIDAVIVNVALQPVDSIEKIYMTVTVSANAVAVEVA